MAYNSTALSNYVPQNVNDVLLPATFGTRFLKEAMAKGNLHTGIKTADKILLIDGPVTLQAGNNCSWVPNGSANITDKTISVAPISIMEEICYDDVRLKYTQVAMAKGSDNFDEVIFAEEFFNIKMARLAEANEMLIFKGDTASSGNLVFMDGLLKQVITGGIASNTSVFTTGGPVATATGITNANVISIFDGIENATPLEISNSETRVVLCGMDVAKRYGQALRTANLFSYAFSQDGNTDFIIPGTNTRVMPVAGLNGTNQILSFDWKNLCLGFDGENEHEEASLKYDESTLKTRFSARYKIGATFARNSEVAYFKLV
jgi:hypothetical protein